MADWQSHVTAHGELQQLDERLWLVTAGEPGRGLTRNMIIYRLDDGGLLLHGVHAVREATLAAIEALGPLRLMIVAGTFHSMDEALYKERFPQLVVATPAPVRSRVARDVAVDEDVEAIAGRYGFTVLEPDGIKPVERVYALPVTGGQAWVIGDMMMNLPDSSGFVGWLFRVLGSTGFFGITGIGRLLMLKDRAAFKAWMLRSAEQDAPRLIVVSHGEAITADCQERLRVAAARL
jgi:hypothetical protein